MSSASDARYMALALALGRRGQGRTAENPPVGCVIVADGRIVGRGWTQDGGRPHAEVVALSQADTSARGATAYVTLEPCAHHGQTPPCSEALIAACVARVVIAVTDPDHRVNGAGIAGLRAAGITVETGVLETQARRDLSGFLTRLTKSRPHLTLKLATSLDGRIATSTGRSKWITGSQARRAVHAMRARHDAVMVGAETAVADDPMLDVRDLGSERQPARVVLSASARLATDSQLVRTASDIPVLLCHGPDAPRDRLAALAAAGVQPIACRMDVNRLSLGDAMAKLADRGLSRIFCEGGGTLGAALLTADLVDELVVISAGCALGGDGIPAIGPLGLDGLETAPRFALSEHRRIGPDLLTCWRRDAPED